MAQILMALPDTDFDPSESSIPWHVLTQAGHTVKFTTFSGQPGRADQLTLTGQKMGPWKNMLQTKEAVKELYEQLIQDSHFKQSIPYEYVQVDDYDGLLLPGGHAPGMKPYLESSILQDKIRRFFQLDKPVGAVCHGVLAVARTKDPLSDQSVLYGRKTTGLPKKMEWPVCMITKPWLGNHYRTYSQMVQDEVIEVLAKPQDFLSGPNSLSHDSDRDHSAGFVVKDGNYISARWPGDCYRFAHEFLKMIEDNDE